MKNRHIVIIGLALMAVMFSACSETYIVHHETEVYAEMWNYSSSGNLQNMSSSNVYYNITGLVSGINKGVTFTSGPQSSGGSRFTINTSGIYKLDWHASYFGGNNQEYGMGPAINYNISNSRNCYSRRTTTTTAKADVSGTCILNLTRGSILNLQVDDEASVPVSINLVVVNLNIELLEIN